jgi:hypothetical protein
MVEMMSSSAESGDSETLERVEAHLYSALNNGEIGDIPHKHVSRAYKLLRTVSMEGEDKESESVKDSHGFFHDEELYPDYGVLHERVKRHASRRFEVEGVDTSPETWEVTYVCLEDSVVHYRVEHEILGKPIFEE